MWKNKLPIRFFFERSKLHRDHLARRKNPDGAVAVFREMKQALLDFSRGAVVFSALVKACVQRKLTKLATEVYDEIKDVCTCSKVTYNTL